MLQLLDRADNVRRKVAPLTAQKHKVEYGQLLTPSSVARFMGPSSQPVCDRVPESLS